MAPPPPFDELAELELDDVEVRRRRGWAASSLLSSPVKTRAADVEGAAGHAGGVGFGDGDAFVCWSIGGFDGRALEALSKAAGIVEHGSRCGAGVKQVSRW